MLASSRKCSNRQNHPESLQGKMRQFMKHEIEFDRIFSDNFNFFFIFSIKTEDEF